MFKDAKCILNEQNSRCYVSTEHPILNMSQFHADRGYTVIHHSNGDIFEGYKKDYFRGETFAKVHRIGNCFMKI